jgi:oligopeptide/dipeptide ABC transporter ATP-binding protein
MGPPKLLSVRDLSIRFATERGTLAAVDGLGFDLDAARTLAIVGESGCGKSATALALMGLLAGNASVAGSVRLSGRELLGLDQAELRRVRGAEIAMIFQEPMTSLNPAFTIGDQIAEAIRRHRGVSAREAWTQAIGWLDRVRMPAARQRASDHPHRLSGGMRQRAMIAMALACTPKLLIADEPTTALDVTIQAQILDLLRELSAETGTAIMLITHDLGVVAEMADAVLVMYAGRAVEQAPAAHLFAAPQHPYTIGLLGAVPRIDAPRARLAAIDGMVPDLRRPIAGCRFMPRCPFAAADCAANAPALAAVAAEHLAACLRAPLDLLPAGAA